jgi:hypothetical protein
MQLHRAASRRKNEDRRLKHHNLALRSPFGLGFGVIVALATFSSVMGEDLKVDSGARTSAAVIAVDDHWLQAEVHGDTAWLDSMLLPEYRSISSDGKVLDKKTLLAHAAKNRGSDRMSKQVEAWLKTHPTRETVVMHGDVAILSFTNPGTARVNSSDIFVYQGGGWHALYSQHSKVD